MCPIPLYPIACVPHTIYTPYPMYPLPPWSPSPHVLYCPYDPSLLSPIGQWATWAIGYREYGVQGVWAMGHRGQCGTGCIGYRGYGAHGDGSTGGNGLQAHLDLLGIGHNVFAMSRKEGHTWHHQKKLESHDATRYFPKQIHVFSIYKKNL